MIIYNWAACFSIKETVHTVKKNNNLHFIVTKNRLKEKWREEKFEYYVICVKFGTLK